MGIGETPSLQKEAIIDGGEQVAKTSELAKDMVLAQRLWNKTEALLTPTTT